MDRIILTTTYTGFNYGTSLQVLAGKHIVSQLGYSCDFIRPKSIIKGRDIRLCKLLAILFRVISLRDYKKLLPFVSSYQKNFIEGTEQLYFKFNEDYIKPLELSKSKMKKLAKESVACLAGSDQIWISDALYVDPIYYLRFAPQYKRIAFAPSFGRDYVAEYNIKKISHWISEIPYLSVREDSGVQLIKQLTGRDAVHLLDPTLVVSRDEWKGILNVCEHKENYILTYFLDMPSDFAIDKIMQLKKYLGCKVINIPYQFEKMDFCDDMISAGPKEFIELVLNARFVCTDSFHGTAFALNFHTPFFTFERLYGNSSKQSVRILSLLKKFNLLTRYQCDCPIRVLDDINFDLVDNILLSEKQKTYNYLHNSIVNIKLHGK